MSGIIVGIDGSGHSERALKWAAQEAVIRQVPLTVVTVHQLMVGYWGSAVNYADERSLAERALELAQAQTDKVLAGLPARPSSVTVQSASGIPSEELLRAATDAGMLVVGSRGTGGFTRLLLGSVSSQVAHHARCPVVIIPADVSELCELSPTGS
jgi:nucleotide-binding universal stress UspA family protein